MIWIEASFDQDELTRTIHFYHLIPIWVFNIFYISNPMTDSCIEDEDGDRLVLGVLVRLGSKNGIYQAQSWVPLTEIGLMGGKCLVRILDLQILCKRLNPGLEQSNWESCGQLASGLACQEEMSNREMMNWRDWKRSVKPHHILRLPTLLRKLHQSHHWYLMSVSIVQKFNTHTHTQSMILCRLSQSLRSEAKRSFIDLFN